MNTPHLLADKKIAIIGGGPAGLMAARLLQLAGYPATVYERDYEAAARLLGGSLDFHKDSGQLALAKAGLLEQFYRLAHPATDRMADRHGRVLFEEQPNPADPYERPEIDRPNFRQLLLGSLAADTVVWNRQVTAVEKTGAHFTLHFQQGAPAAADVVIVADGTGSKARQYVQEAPPVHTGTYYVQGEVYQPELACPAIWELAAGGNLAAIEARKCLFLHTKGNGHLSFYASFRLPAAELAARLPDWRNCPAGAALLHELFAGWAPVYHTMFDASDEYRGFSMRAVLVQTPWQPHANITLIGDAAHAMPPFGAQGANMGLVDALNLVENLTNGQFATVQAAIDAYEQKMFAYAAPAQQLALAADERIHTQEANFAERMSQMMQAREASREPQWL